MKHHPCRWALRLALVWSVAVAGALAAPPEEAATAESPTPVDITVAIGNRLFPAFHETTTTAMNERWFIGDTDYAFEITAFVPHFAIIDSTREVVSLSDEVKNPAFKIRIYEGEDMLEDSWGFYGIRIPHFSRESFLSFQVISFEYRGVVYGATPGKESSAQ
jgi:hypothetical protein